MAMAVEQQQHLLSSPQAATAADLSMRQILHWADVGVIQPAVAGFGSGGRHRWAPTQVTLLALLGRLSALGARLNVLRSVAAGIHTDLAGRNDLFVVVGGDGNPIIANAEGVGPMAHQIGACWVIPIRTTSQGAA
jgi:hypothetical protein